MTGAHARLLPHFFKKFFLLPSFREKFAVFLNKSCFLVVTFFSIDPFFVTTSAAG